MAMVRKSRCCEALTCFVSSTAAHGLAATRMMPDRGSGAGKLYDPTISLVKIGGLLMLLIPS